MTNWKINGVKVNVPTLREVCVSPEEWFKRFGVFVPSTNGGYIYRRNGGKILAVAHLDIATNPKLDRTIFNAYERWVTPTEEQLKADPDRKPYMVHVVENDNLDDRLGAWIILYVLPKLIGSNKFDFLLTTNEEVGRTTANDFMRDWNDWTTEDRPDYNWIVQFDRRGEDVVLYGYDDWANGAWHSALAKYFTVGSGSFSCISAMEGMGVKGFNVGIGYHGEHSPGHFAVLEQTTRQLRRFKEFFKANQETKFAHTARPRTYFYYSNGVCHTYYDDDYYSGSYSGTYGSSPTRSDTSYANQMAEDYAKSHQKCPICGHARTLYIGTAHPYPIGCATCLRQKHELAYPNYQLLAKWTRESETRPTKNDCDWCGRTQSSALHELEDHTGNILLLCDDCYGVEIDAATNLPLPFRPETGGEALLDACEVCGKESFSNLHYYDRTENRVRVLCEACYSIGLSMQTVPDSPPRLPPPKADSELIRRLTQRCSRCPDSANSEIYTTLTHQNGVKVHFCEEHYWEYRQDPESGPVSGHCDFCGQHTKKLHLVFANGYYFEVCDRHPPVKLGWQQSQSTPVPELNTTYCQNCHKPIGLFETIAVEDDQGNPALCLNCQENGGQGNVQ